MHKTVDRKRSIEMTFIQREQQEQDWSMREVSQELRVTDRAVTWAHFTAGSEQDQVGDTDKFYLQSQRRQGN